jgi:hypothetical protein
VAKTQGWENDGFGSHVYRFVRNEMAKIESYQGQESNQEHHYFYVWNPDTD